MDNNIMELSPLDKNIENLTKQILSETDENKSKDLIHLFNLNQSKKNVLRSNKYSDMLELVIKQMMERIIKTPDNFSNDDLLKFFTAVNSALSKTSDTISQIDEMPAIQINNTQINVQSEDKLSREEKERTIDAVKALLAQMNSVQDAEFIESEN